MPESAIRPRSSTGSDSLRLWANLVLVHLGVLIVGTAWWFGGQSVGARLGLLVWGSLGIPLFFAAWGAQRAQGGPRLKPWRYLWPLVVFDILVLISCINPSTRVILHEGESMFVHTDPRWPWLPSSARPDLSLRELWQFNAIVISAFNAFFVLSRRRWMRRLLAILAGNALLLSVFGTFQKLGGADGLWFGLVKTPQPYFFSTFVYHNSWGAFTVLNVTICLGLLFYSLRRGGHRDFWHSPVPLGGVAIAFIAATAPLSGSRSTTVLMLLLLLLATAQFLAYAIRSRRAHHESIVLPVVGIVLAFALTVGGAVYLSYGVVAKRAELTARQIERIRNEDTLNSRLVLYRDTWEMASRKPVFGWGLETYGDVFRIFNTQRAVELKIGQPYYREAHNDWFQSLAEVGFVGTFALICLGLAPLWGMRQGTSESHLPRHLLTGCGVVLAYAWVEFPFANPAVMMLFWTCLYVAAAYARAEEPRSLPVT